ncbi:SAM-dependent methyltransferase [Bacillus sp. AFS054943]|uniref:SAM-dependent methyltransferase n=1 Tax=Bacillus cereus TaxID=1396 RepID=A0A2C1L4P9_BACCE|nr:MULTISPECIES: DUF6094 domain-containing protein [Bacillus]PGL78049.1 SAM-dependent methyltransferase [Bacillus sp. AFS054943]PGT99835.1 SAM-dependent methyltransferase [Bacillus cereus]
MRIGNHIKAGFYATPILEVGTYLAELFKLEEAAGDLQHMWLDPCAGEGEILDYLSDFHKANGHEISKYGVELEEKRWRKADEVLDVTVRSSFEQMMISHKSYSLIYLNPPYNYEVKVGEEKAELMEFSFLRRSHLYLQEGGIMIYVVPADRFAEPQINEFLGKNYEEIGIMRFDDENGAYEQFKQCVFVGRKRVKEKNDNYINERFTQFCSRFHEADFVLTNVNTISQIAGNKIWSVPGVKKLPKFTFATRVEYKTAFEGIGESDGIATFKKRISKGNGFELGAAASDADRPKMPIAQGQLGLLLITGVADGLLGQEENLHVVRGSENVYYESHFEEFESCTKETIRQKRRAKFIVALPDGTINELV